MDNLAKTVLFGTGGVLIGGLYSFIQDIQSSTDTNEPRLSVQYHFIQYDEPILQVLVSMEEEAMKLDAVAFVRIVMYIDDLIRIRYNVTDQSSKDRVDSVIAFRSAKAAIQRLLSTAEETNISPRQLIYLQKKAQKLISLMQTHSHVIFMVTRD
jgi:hypothetical protein